MRTMIIYDNAGYIVDIGGGEPSPREPVGIPFMFVEIPQGKRIKITDGIGVDTSITPHQVVLEDIPPSEIDSLKEENVKIKESMAELAELILGGM